MAGDIRVSGLVGGSIRAAAGVIAVTGQVAEDSVLAGGEVRIEPGARVGRDAFVAANEATLQAPVAGDVQAAAETLTIGGSVTGSVRAEVGTLRLTDDASIGGSLRY